MLGGSRRANERRPRHFRSSPELGSIASAQSTNTDARTNMKIAMVVRRPSPERRKQVVPSWLSLFERFAKSHDIHAFALKHLPPPQTYSLRGFTVHDLGRPSAPFGLARRVQERALTRALDPPVRLI